MPEPYARFFEREISSLDYNVRLLALAGTEVVSAVQGAKLTAIVSRNVDEFFQNRFSTLRGKSTTWADAAQGGASCGEWADTIRVGARELVEWATRTFAEKLCPSLAAVGVHILDWHELSSSEQTPLRRVADERIFPILTPLAVDAGHPFPCISDLSINLAVIVRDPQHAVYRLVCLEAPRGVPRFLALANEQRFVPIEQVIGADLDRLFPAMEIVSHHSFRVTRTAGRDYGAGLADELADELLDAPESPLRRRRRRWRSHRAVRLEVTRSMPPEVRSVLLRELALGRSDLCVVDGPLGLADLLELRRLAIPAEPRATSFANVRIIRSG